MGPLQKFWVMRSQFETYTRYSGVDVETKKKVLFNLSGNFETLLDTMEISRPQGNNLKLTLHILL